MTGVGGPGGLYHRAIVEAARRATGAGRLSSADASASVDNPLCGDRVIIDVAIEGGRVSAIAHRVKGCVLCEAAASVLAANAVGRRAEALAGVGRTLAEALANGFDKHVLPWPDLEMFAPVAGHRSRRRCVTLPFEALSDALTEALPRKATL